MDRDSGVLIVLIANIPSVRESRQLESEISHDERSEPVLMKAGLSGWYAFDIADCFLRYLFMFALVKAP